MSRVIYALFAQIVMKVCKMPRLKSQIGFNCFRKFVVPRLTTSKQFWIG